MPEGKSGFSLSFSTREGKEGLVGRFLAALLLFLGLGGCLWSIAGLAESGANPLVLLCAGSLYCLVSCGLPGKRRCLYVAAIIIPAVFTVFAGRYILEGWNILANHIFLTLESHLGRIFPRYAVDAETNQQLCLNMFLLLPAIILAALCGRAGVVGRYLILALLALIIWCAALLFQVTLPLLLVAMLIVAAAVLLGRKKLKGSLTPCGESLLWPLVMVVMLIALTAVPALAFNQADSPNTNSARRSAAEKIHTIRYEKNMRADENSAFLPEGDFQKLADFTANEEDVLLATVERAGNYYLRGYVGEVYNGDRWTGLSPGTRAEYATLFSWLHSRGFYAQNQHALLTQALGLPVAANSIQIENAGACTEFLYAPYELVENKQDQERIGDENLLASGLRGQNAYALTASAGSVLEYEQHYEALVAARNRNEAAVIAYLTNENAYRNFVYENYLQIAEQAQVSIEKFLNTLNLPEGKIAFADAKMVVETYLSTLYYHPAPESISSSEDFLSYFLEESRAGNSVHFATAATLIFRYLGVPARYVEGYVLNKDELIPGSAFSVSGGNTHAWAEIYRDGVGFVPFEINLLDLTMPEFNEPAPQDTSEILPETISPASPLKNLPSPLRILMVILLLLLGVFLLLMIHRALKRRKINKLLRHADNAQAVAYTVTYLVQILAFEGIIYRNGSLFRLCTMLENKYGAGLRQEFEAVIQLQQAVLFSGKQVTDEARAGVSDFLIKLLDKMKKQASPYQRFRLKWIYCVY